MATIVGSGDFRYEVDKEWGRREGGVAALGLVSGHAADAQDRLYVFIRQPDPCVMVFDRGGKLLTTWGQGQFGHPHGLWISPQQEMYLTDRDTHLVTKARLDGTVIRTWGTERQAGPPGEPFNEPTNVFVAADSEMYVSDGYGQKRVHRFGADGNLIQSWGEEGTGPGQFGWPVHHVIVDSRDRVLVCDRGNNRVQHFDRCGCYTGEWSDLMAPNQVAIKDDIVYIAEGGQRIAIMTLDGEIITRWGSKGPGQDQFTDSPHSLTIDSRGDIYVGEVIAHDRMQKFVRI